MDKLGRVGHWCIWTGEGLISMLEVLRTFCYFCCFSFYCHTFKTSFKVIKTFFLVKSKMTLKSPNVMIHEMLGTNGGKDSVCIREFLGDKMVATCKVDDIETVRSYAAV